MVVDVVGNVVEVELDPLRCHWRLMGVVGGEGRGWLRLLRRAVGRLGGEDQLLGKGEKGEGGGGVEEKLVS